MKSTAEGEVARHLKSWDIVAFLGLLTFITTLVYEVGRAAYWGFPAELIRFSPENAFFTFLRLAGLGVMAGLVAQVAAEWKWYRKMVMALCLLVMLIGSYFIWRRWGAPGLLVLLAGAGYSVGALQLLWGSDPGDQGISQWLLRALGKGGLALSATLVVVPYAAVTLGYWLASSQEEFLVTTSEPRQVVLATYGSEAVCAQLNQGPSGKWIARSFRLLDLSSEQAGALTAEHLGRIEVRSR